MKILKQDHPGDITGQTITKVILNDTEQACSVCKWMHAPELACWEFNNLDLEIPGSKTGTVNQMPTRSNTDYSVKGGTTTQLQPFTVWTWSPYVPKSV